MSIHKKKENLTPHSSLSIGILAVPRTLSSPQMREEDYSTSTPALDSEEAWGTLDTNN